jgi:hypothetical protein
VRLRPHDPATPAALAATARRRNRNRRIVGAALAVLIAAGSAVGVSAGLGHRGDGGGQLTPAGVPGTVRVRTGAPATLPALPVQSTAAAVAQDGTLWLGLTTRTASSPSGLYRVRPGDPRALLVRPLAGNGFDVAATDHYVWVRPNRQSHPQQTLFQYDASTGREVAEYPVLLGSGPVAAGGDDVWIASGPYQRQSAVLVSGAGRRVVRSVEIPTRHVTVLTTPIVAGDYLFVGADQGVVRIGRDGRTTPVRPTTLADDYIAPLASSGRTVLIGTMGLSPVRVVAVDAATLAMTGRIDLAKNEFIWFSGGARLVGTAENRILMWDLPGLRSRPVVGDVGVDVPVVVSAQTAGSGAPAWLMTNSDRTVTARPLTFTATR